MSAVNEDIFRFDGNNHWALHDDKQFRSRCKVKTCNFFSHLYCQKCGVHLCLTSKRNCFYDYHCRPTGLKRKMETHLDQKQVKNAEVVGKGRSKCPTGSNVIAKQLGLTSGRSRMTAENDSRSAQCSIGLNVGANPSGPRLCRTRKQVEKAIEIKKKQSEQGSNTVTMNGPHKDKEKRFMNTLGLYRVGERKNIL